MRRRFFQTYKNSEENLTLVSLEDNNEIYLDMTMSFIGEIEMRVNGDFKWMPCDTVMLNKGDFIEYRGTISKLTGGADRIGTFRISKKVNLYGDCTSILKDRMLFNYSLAYLFENTPVVNVHSTFLPATTLATCCYQYMFKGCTSLVNAPELPATTLAGYCYESMFYGCTSLTVAPELSATSLDTNCYSNMFKGCTNLITAPLLPATTLAKSCYYHMFEDCTSLVNAPELSATSLDTNCYSNMFKGCTSLVNAPELPATTLAGYCYKSMFYGCTNLNYIKMLATDISASNCLLYWVNGVSSTGTFVKNKDATWDTTPGALGSSGVPAGWTVVNDGEESGEGDLTTFYLNDEAELYKMKASPGMTWEDWINSTYVPTEGDLINFRLYKLGSYYAIILYHELASQDMFIYEEDGIYQNVLSHNKIENGKTYLIH